MSSTFQLNCNVKRSLFNPKSNHTPSISVRSNYQTAIHLLHYASLILPISTCAILYDLDPHVHPFITTFIATSFITMYWISFVSDITILPPIYSLQKPVADAAADIKSNYYKSRFHISYLTPSGFV
eukprot:268337_1